MSMSTAGAWRPKDTLALRLISVRHELGMSQREAALRTGVPFGTWQGMEQGRDTRGLDRHVQSIVSALGVDRDWLMWGEPHTPEQAVTDGYPTDNPGFLAAAS